MSSVQETSFKTSLPVMLGYFPVAITFGLLASQQGLSLGITASLSVLVFAGSAQFVGLALLGAQAPSLAQVFVSIWLLNLRHFVLSLAYLAHTHGWKPLERARFYPFLTDETFAVLSITERLKADPRGAFRTALLNYSSWVAGTVFGHGFGSLVPDPKRLGLDFALTAMFVALVVLFIKKRSHWITLGCAVGLTVLFYGVLDFGKNSVMAAALIGSGMGWAWERRQAS